MKIGIFDSGLGGLVLTKAITNALPTYDYIYLGDTLHVPYGPRSGEAIYEFTKKAVDFLFRQDCQLIIIACNTASASALRRLQQEYLPVHYPQRRILGVVVPTLEEALSSGHHNLGLIATSFVVNSDIYAIELQKMDPQIKICAKATPLLVPLIENDGLDYVSAPLKDYLKPLIDQKIDGLILGCTHYPLLKPLLKNILPPHIDLISQDDFLPAKLENYLERHPEIEATLSRKSHYRFCVTDLAASYQTMANKIFGKPVKLEKVVL
ncbi:MAG TPA: glutamate racemase [Alphaproteobacteria bacterium]